MIAHIASGGSKVRWRIAEGDGLIWGEVNGLKLIHPALSARADVLSQQRPDDSHRTVALTPSGDVVFSTASIGFVPREGEDTGSYMEELFEICSDLLLWIRYLSFQHQIPSSPSVFVVSQETELDVELDPLPDEDSTVRGYGRAYLTECVASRQVAVAAAEKVSARERVPVHHHLLVDAFAVLEGRDYRQAILFAAMAAETMAASRLEAEYDRVLSTSGDSRFRVVESQRTGGSTARKDPVYESLASRTSFAALLHERPLYLMNKSLLHEKQSVYKTARQMYSARNKIVHRGELSEGDSSNALSLDESGARAALGCAIAILEWFGDPVSHFPRDRLIPLPHAHWHGLSLH